VSRVERGEGPDRPGGLRASLTSFVGRESETADVTRLLERHQLVTVTGPGGVGKTRLAVEAARRAADQFPDGVRMVELAPVREGTQVAAHLMTVLGLGERPGAAAADLLAEALAQRRMLLVLDNCEHVLDAAAEVCGSLLQAVDDVRILATSREHLWVAGETRYRLSPLRLPESADPEEVSRSEAVALFIDRALRTDPRFSLDGGNTALAARVVERLDGMPLAIELAAARVESLGIRGLAGVIDDAVRLLAGPDRSAGSRHRSLEAVADWSYQLLSEPERRVLRRLAVFPGPFTLEAAEAVAGPDASPVVLRLVDCSLLVPPQPGDDRRMRYTMLQTLRAFSTGRLTAAGEQPDAMAALCGFALTVTGAAWAGLQSTDTEPEALRWLDAEDATLSAALDWAQAHNPAAALQIAAGLALWWWRRGRLTEARARLAAAVRDASPASQGWAAAQTWLGRILSVLGDLPGEMGCYTAAYELSRDTDTDVFVWRVASLANRSVAKLNLADAAGAADDAARALQLARDAGYRAGEAAALTAQSLAAFYRGDRAAALDLARQAEQILCGNVPVYVARWVLQSLTTVLSSAGELDWARRVCTAAIDLAREVDNLTHLSILLVRKAELELRTGNPAVAGADLRQAAALAAPTGNRHALGNCIDCCGFLCAATGRWAEAVTLWAAADTYRAELGLPGPATEMIGLQRTGYMSQAERALRPAQIRDARQRGAGMSLYAAMEYTTILTEPTSPEDQNAPGQGTLSIRERELVTLVAQGCTNAQAAAKLHISVYTVRSHLDRIRDKTGCRRRADLTRLALRQGLI
jgi:predicted ATPase/DNA-binding CsgD family transcriptional regulator